MLYILRNFDLHIRSTCAVLAHFVFCWMRDKIKFSKELFSQACYVGCFLGVCGSPPGCVCMRALLGGVPEPPAGGLVGGGQWQEGEEQAPSALSPGAGRQSIESMECVGDSRGYFFFSPSRSGVISSARATASFFFCPGIKLVPWTYFSRSPAPPI